MKQINKINKSEKSYATEKNIFVKHNLKPINQLNINS
jgi:hypothetical protein